MSRDDLDTANRHWWVFGLLAVGAFVIWYEMAHGFMGVRYSGPPLMEYPTGVLVAAAVFQLAVPFGIMFWIRRRHNT